MRQRIKPFKKVAIIAMFFTALHLVEDMIWLAIGRYTEVPFWAVILAIICFGVFRIAKREYKDNPESTFTPLPRDITPLGIELDPTTGVDLSNSENAKK